MTRPVRPGLVVLDLRHLDDVDDKMTIKPVDGPPFRFISLGTDCQPALQISMHRPNNVMHLLDWLAVPIRQPIALIENDFEGFLEPDNLHPLQLHPRVGWPKITQPLGSTA